LRRIKVRRDAERNFVELSRRFPKDASKRPNGTSYAEGTRKSSRKPLNKKWWEVEQPRGPLETESFKGRNGMRQNTEKR